MGFLILHSHCHPAREDLPTGADSDLQTHLRVTRVYENNYNQEGLIPETYIRTLLILTCRIQSVESRYSIAVEHPEMAVVTGKQAGFTGGHNMIAHNITTGRGRENKEEMCVSALLGALL